MDHYILESFHNLDCEKVSVAVMVELRDGECNVNDSLHCFDL